MLPAAGLDHTPEFPLARTLQYNIWISSLERPLTEPLCPPETGLLFSETVRKGCHNRRVYG